MKQPTALQASGSCLLIGCSVSEGSLRSQGWFVAPAWSSLFANRYTGGGSNRQGRDNFHELLAKMLVA